MAGVIEADKYRQYSGYLFEQEEEVVLVGSKIDSYTGEVESGYVFLKFVPDGEFKEWLNGMVEHRDPVTVYFSRSIDNKECTFAYNNNGRIVLKTFDNLETVPVEGI